MFTRFESASTVLRTTLFAALYLIAVLYVRHISSRDPTSLFFDPRQAHVPLYSTVRQQQAEALIFALETQILPPQDNSKGGLSDKKLCVGIPSVAREGASYLRASVGSLLDGLSVEERDSIFLIIFIAHTDPSIHFAYKRIGFTTLQIGYSSTIYRKISWNTSQLSRKMQTYSGRRDFSTIPIF
jgi:hypothetical protein